MPAQGFPDYSIGFVGAIAVPNGGTGLESIDTNAIMLGNLLAPVKLVDPGTSGQVLTMTGSPLAPGWADVPGVTLTAGANISISDLTIALVGSPAVTSLSATPASSGAGVKISSNQSTDIDGILDLWDAAAPARRGLMGAAAGAGELLGGSAAGDVCLRADTGSLRLGTSTTAAITLDQSQIVTLAHPLAVAQGGTGTASPALVAGSNMAVSGSFPAQTVALSATPSVTSLSATPASSGQGAIVHGNTVTPIAPLFGLYDDTGSARRGALGLASAAGNYSASASAGDIVLLADTGTLRLATNGVDALSISQSQVLTLAHPLAVAQGGTGTASPALVAGSNMAVSGSFPAQTVALSATPSVTSLSATPTTTATGVKISSNQSTDIDGILDLWDAAAPARRGLMGAAAGAGELLSASAAGDVCLRADTGSLILGTSTTAAITLDQSQAVSLTSKIKSYNGATTAGQGLAPVLYESTGAAQTTTITPISFTTPAGTAVFRVGVNIEIETGTSVGVSAEVIYTSISGTARTVPLASTASTDSPPIAYVGGIFPTAGAHAFQVKITPSGTETFAYAVTVEQLV